MTKAQTDSRAGLLPSKSWDAYLETLRLLREACNDGPADRVRFLVALGLVSDTSQTTESGKTLYDAVFVHGDEDVAQRVLTEALLCYPPAMAILQLLSRARGVSRKNVEAVSRSRGFLHGQADRCIGSLLMLLNRAEFVEYDKPQWVCPSSLDTI